MTINKTFVKPVVHEKKRILLLKEFQPIVNVSDIYSKNWTCYVIGNVSWLAWSEAHWDEISTRLIALDLILTDYSKSLSLYKFSSAAQPTGKLWNWMVMYLTLIGMRQGGFTPLIIFGLVFYSWIFIKNFQTFLEVKIEINWDNLTPCQAHWVL